MTKIVNRRLGVSEYPLREANKFLTVILPSIKDQKMSDLNRKPNRVLLFVARHKKTIIASAMAGGCLLSISTRCNCLNTEYFEAAFGAIIVVFLILNIVLFYIAKRFGTYFSFPFSALFFKLKHTSTSAKQMAISLTYLDHIKEQHLRTKVFLLLCAGLMAILNIKFPGLELMNLVTVAIVFEGLIALKELLIEFRIRKGLFGTNSTEARELINFIIQNSKDIDFTDGDGKLRRALLSNKNSEVKQTTGTIHDGVTP